MYFSDRSVVEAASWRLASELMRRHPGEARLFRGHPGGGNYDLLWIKGLRRSKLDLRLNRVGTIQVWGRADGGQHIPWEATEWAEFLAEEPRVFVQRLERAAGWTAPEKVPSSTNETLTFRVLAALAAIGFKTVHPIIIEEGFIDSSGEESGHNPSMEMFDFPTELLRARPDDFFGEPGYRFWIPTRDGTPLCAIEQTSGTAWFVGNAEPINLMSLYRKNFKETSLVASKLLRVSLDSIR